MPHFLQSRIKNTSLVILYWIGWLVLTRGIMFLLPLVPGTFRPYVIGVVASLIAWGLFRIIKRRVLLPPHQPVPVSRQLFLFILGIGAGCLLFTLMIACLVGFTDLGIRYTGRRFDSGLLVYLLAFIPLALMEEIAFRGPSLRSLDRSLGTRGALVISAVAFALYHLSSHYTLAVAFAGPFVWAFIFGIAAISTKGIALSTGIHVALNVAQALLGMKGTTGAIMELNAGHGVNPAKISGAENTGLLMQAALFLASWILIELYLRRRKNTVGMRR